MGQRDPRPELFGLVALMAELRAFGVPEDRSAAILASAVQIGVHASAARSETPWRVAEVMVRRRAAGERRGANGR